MTRCNARKRCNVVTVVNTQILMLKEKDGLDNTLIHSWLNHTDAWKWKQKQSCCCLTCYVPHDVSQLTEASSAICGQHRPPWNMSIGSHWQCETLFGLLHNHFFCFLISPIVVRRHHSGLELGKQTAEQAALSLAWQTMGLATSEKLVVESNDKHGKWNR